MQKFKVQDKYCERLSRNQRKVDTALLMNDHAHKYTQKRVCVSERERNAKCPISDKLHLSAFPFPNADTEVLIGKATVMN